MKIQQLSLIAIITFSHAKADESLPYDVQALIHQRDVAIEKIDQTHIAQLEKLKLSYTKNGNLDVAVKINERIKILKKSGKEEKEEKSEKYWFIGTRWKAQGIEITFKDKVVMHSNVSKPMEYSVSSDGQISYKGQVQDVTIKFNADRKSGDFRGSKGFGSGPIVLIEEENDPLPPG